MEPAVANNNEEADITAPGQRWGRGADSVLPYLTRSLQSRPMGLLEARELGSKPGQPSSTDRAGKPRQIM